MNKQTLNLEFLTIDKDSDLEILDQKLLDSATEAAKKAYAPYSQFKVGAAVLLENGVIISGNNQENAAYPSSLCAERVTLYYASANYPGIPVKAIAITATSATAELNTPVTPCGACRQVMKEYEKLAKGPIKVIMKGETGSILISPSVENLIPFSFDGTHLKTNNL